MEEKFEVDENKTDARTISETLKVIDNLSYDALMYRQWYEEGNERIKNFKKV